jgi:hypothetical protein
VPFTSLKEMSAGRKRVRIRIIPVFPCARRWLSMAFGYLKIISNQSRKIDSAAM